MVIGFLPLDSRPCTYDFPVQLALQSGARVLLPPKGSISFYDDPVYPEKNRKWLREIAPDCDALVISAEQFLHGGLIASRKTRMSQEEQFAALAEIKTIKKENPSIRIFLSTVLMRTSISALDEQSRNWWEKVNVYSRLRYLAMTGADGEIMRQYDQIQREIPESVIESFLTARKVNHEVNRACIRLAADSIVDELLILQEDCAPEGIHWLEQRILLKDIEDNALGDRVFLFNGADEAGAELIQRALHPEGYDADVVWLSSQTDFMANYEDRPFAENLKGHMKALGIREKPGAEKVVCILPPKQKQGEASLPRTGRSVDYTKEELTGIAREIKRLSDGGRKCCLLDLDFANGGNVSLLCALAECMPVTDLWGYAGWNTASNSLGMLLSQLLSTEENSASNKNFTTERILDDAIYQSVVRAEVAKRLQETGENPFRIRFVQKAEQILTETFHRHQPLLASVFADNLPDFRTKLRWNRLFEAEIFVNGNGPVYTEENPVS